MPTSPPWNGRLVIASVDPTGDAAAEGDVEGVARATAELLGDGLDDGLEDGLVTGVAFGGLHVGWHAAAVNSRTTSGPQVRQTLPLTLDREFMAIDAQVRHANCRIRATHVSTGRQIRLKLRWATRFTIALATIWLAMSGLVAGHAFTLIGAILTVAPQTGTPTAPFTVRGVYSTSCVGLGTFTFVFYWDTTIAQLTQKTVPCNPASGFDTGLISGQVPA